MNIQPIVQAASASLRVQCAKGCQKVFDCQSKDFVRVRLADLNGIYESGIACPLCGTFYIAAYDSDALIALRKEVQQARGQYRKLLQNAYMRDFRILQKEMVERERVAREAKEQEVKDAGQDN